MPSTFTVTNTADSGTGSLRQAILDANGSTGASTINFDIGSGTQTINLLSALPAVSVQVTIDATAPGGFPTQEVQLNGSGAGNGSDGLDITGGDSVIEGDDHLAIDNFSGSGIVLDALGGGDVVEGTFVGTNAASASGLGNGTGITIPFNGTPNNTIGGTGGGNFISGNTTSGIVITGSGATGNVIADNVIGTDTSGTKAIPNGEDGILIAGGASGNSVAGGTNLISANLGDGVYISGTGTDGNVVSGNVIGTDVTGQKALGNSSAGVAIDSGASNNTVGATSGGIINLISGNHGDGVDIDIATSGNLVDDNAIGTDVSGGTAVPNGGEGVLVEGSRNTVGGTGGGAINLISGNSGLGVVIDDAEGDVVDNNAIGTDSSGTKALGNLMGGLEDGDGQGDTIGGTVGTAINLISGNTGVAQVLLEGTTSDLIASNAIGTDVSGTKSFSSSTGDGIFIQYGASGTQIGVTGFSHLNLISGNQGNGITITGSGTDNTVIEDAAIGTDVSGSLALPNGGNGVEVENGATGTEVGVPGTTNIISGNTGDGILIMGSNGNIVQGDVIGANVGGSGGVPNGGAGVEIAGNNNVVGDMLSSGILSGQGNIIAFNAGFGVQVDSGTGNGIHENAIHENTAGGISLASGANNNVMAPVLSTVTVNGSGTTIMGTLSGTPNTMYFIEFYLNPSTPAQGETQTFFFTTVTTGSTGSVTFTAMTGTMFPSGEFVTATATDPGADTSEFSASVPS